MIKEPLFHFVVISLLIFVYFEAFPKASEEQGDLFEIVFDQSEIQRLKDSWARSWGRPPDEEQLSNLLENAVKEEVYYREALRLGLDKNDTVVRNRMVQKIRFLNSELVSNPTEEQLENHLSENLELYRSGASYSFQQVYLGQDYDASLTASLAEQLNEKQIEPKQISKPLSVPNRIDNASERAVARQFGQDFLEHLTSNKLPNSRWVGPVKSGYGIHLVYLDQLIPGQDPSLDNTAVRQRVINDWTAEQGNLIEERIFAEIKKDYSVRIL